MNQWKHKILAHGTLIITNWVYLTYLIGASCRGSLLLSAWQDAIFSVAVCMLRGVLLWQLQYISTFCCGSIHFILKWQLTPLAVAVFTFCCGSIYFLLWQLTPLAVAVSTFCCGSIHFLLWKLTPLAVAVSTFCCGSIHFLLWQLTPLAVAVSTFFCGSSSVLDQVVRGRCHFWGYIQAISPDNFSTEDHARANS